MNKIDISILDKIIFGRVEPKIYAFTTETIPNYLKIGDTYRPIQTRLDEWRKYFPNLEQKFDEVAKVDNNTFFRDHAIHSFIEKDLQKQRLLPKSLLNIPYYSNEFFKDTSKEDLINAIKDIKSSFKKNNNKYQFYEFDKSRVPLTHTYLRTADYEPRPNQTETIKRFSEAVKNGRNNLLMYAVMRFGKSFTSLCCAVEIKAQLVVVVSAKADVKEEWKKTTESHKKFAEYVFIDSKSLLEKKSKINDNLKSNQKMVLFLTLQDLQGDEVKSKHKEIFSNVIDLLIIDETHFGARAEQYGKILRNDLSPKELKNELKTDTEILEDADETIKLLNAKIKLHLSGTPYRILMNSEFSKEDIIAFYQFSNITEDQERWDLDNINKDEVKEWDNPYFGFPKMIRFAFNANKSSQIRMKEMEKAGITFSMSALFKPKSVSKDSIGNLHKKFVHENEILDLFKVIDGSKDDENLLGFLDNKKLKEGNMCRHMVLVLPYKATCDSLEKLITENKFKNLNKYKILNISGLDGEKNFKDTQTIQSKIKEYESKGQMTITLTVNRMLTGSTVPEWDTMLYFKDTSSPQEYDQAVFRLQNQYTRVYKDKNGDEVKFNMKPQTILVDFNPNRIFELQEQKAQFYNVNTEINGNTKLEERIRRELQVSPIITLNKDKLVEVSPSDITNEVRKYSSSRSVLDEATIIGIDMSLLNIDDIKREIEKQNEIGSKQGLELKAVEGDGDELDLGDTPDNKVNNKEDKGSVEEDKEESDLRKKFAMYYAKILFFSLLTNSKVKSLEEIIESIRSNTDNLRIIENLGVSMKVLELINKKINHFILSDLDYKIHNINTLANDDTLNPLERVSIALKKFGRLSISEVVTPEFIADKMVGGLPIESINEDTKFLDIASKQGEFVYAVYKRFGKKVANNFYSIPTSKIAYEFTRKVYKLLDLDISKIEENYTAYDFVETTELINGDNVIMNNENMKFDVIVGNPPYQKNIGSTANKSLSRQLYPDFITACINLKPRLLSLITPSRWFTADAQDSSFLRLRDFIQSNNHISHIVNYFDGKEVFGSSVTTGAVSFFLYDKDFKGNVLFTEVNKKNISEVTRPLFEKGLDIIIPMNSMTSILEKVTCKKFQSIQDMVTGRNPFGVPSTDSELIAITTSLKSKKNDIKILCAYEEERYISRDAITKNLDLSKKWKVFTSKMNGGAGTLLDGKSVQIIGKTFIADPNTVCSNALISIGNFDNSKDVEKLNKYMKTKFFRFMIGIMKVSQVLTSNVYKFVPNQDFTSKSDINWNESVENIDKQLYKKYKLTKEEIKFIEDSIKPMK